MKIKNKIVTFTPLSSLSENEDSVNKKLLAMSKKERNLFFSENFIADCSVKKTFYMGQDSDYSAYWSYSCKDKNTNKSHNFVVQIANGKNLKVNILPCNIFKKVVGQKCFTKF
jgi:hypothetical protein